MPVILHEQNAVLGRANRFLARHAIVLALSFAATERVPEVAATVLTGNPVRPAVAALAEQGYAPPTDTVRLLVLGGSLGARVFSDVVPAGDRLAARRICARGCPSCSSAARRTSIACAPPMRVAASRRSCPRSSPTSPTGWPRRTW